MTGDAADTNSNGLNPPDNFLYVGVENRDEMYRIKPDTMTIFDTFSLNETVTKHFPPGSFLENSTEILWYDPQVDKNYTAAVTPIFSKVRKISATLETQDFFMLTRPNYTASPFFPFVRFKITNTFSSTSSSTTTLISSTIDCEYPQQNVLTFSHDIINYTGGTPKTNKVIPAIYPDGGSTNLETLMYIAGVLPNASVTEGDPFSKSLQITFFLQKIF